MSTDRLLAGRYRLESVLGRGGMGQVWLGRDETLGRPVAVKEIRLPTALRDDERDALCSRMLREARLTARLSHPGVVTIYDVVSADGRPFIVMELLQVPTLADEVAADGPLPPQRVAAIGLELLTALDAAHREGIVHRDVKPSNVLLADGRVVLSDFGIATSESDPRLTATGLLVGSPMYMSPERLRGDPTGPETDMWSLGATLYAAAEGQPPFEGGTTMGTVLAVLGEELRAPAVGGDLGRALSGLLDKDPDRRLDSGQAARLLQRAVDGPGLAAPSGGDGLPWAVAGASTGVGRPVGGGDVPIWDSSPAARDRESPAGESDRPPGSSAGLAPDPSPGSGARAVEETGSPPSQRPGARSLLLALVALGVLAIVIVGIVAFVVVRDDTPPQSPSTPQATTDAPTATASNSPSTDDEATEQSTPRATTRPTPAAPASDVPAGFSVQDDPLGFRVAVPDGWQRRLDGPTRVDYVAPDGSAYVRIDQQAEAGPSAEQAWLDAEPAVAEQLPGYERISIEPVDYRSWDVADWEFTWSGDNGTVHVLNRGIATDTRGFALYVSTPDAEWESVGRPVFDSAAATFEPVG